MERRQTVPSVPPRVLPAEDEDDIIIGDDDSFIVVDMTARVVVLTTGSHGDAFDMLHAYARQHGAEVIVARVIGRKES
jgi:hypothetical protein